MKFFNDVLNHPKQAEKDFDANVSKQDIRNAYLAGKATAEANRKSKIKLDF